MAGNNNYISAAEAEQRRLKALDEYKMLDIPLSAELKGLTEMAAISCQTPIAYISLIDGEKLWFKSAIGINSTSVRRERSYCWRAISHTGVTVINDTVNDKEEWVNMDYTDKIVRFYAGAPLRTAEGYNIGTIAVMDYVPREFNADRQAMLALLAQEVIHRLDLKLKYKDYQSGVKRVLEKRYTRLGHYYNSILNGTHYAVIFTDPQGIIKTFNAGAESMLGYKADEVIDKVSLLKFNVKDELKARVRQLNEEGFTVSDDFEALSAKATKGNTDVREWTYLRRNKSALTVQLSVKHIEDSHEGIIGYLAIAEDISEKSRIEKQLKLSEERHRLFFENSQGIMFTHDAQGNLLSLNEAGAAFLGYRPSELIGRSINDIVPASFRQQMPLYLASITRHGFDSGVIKLLHKDGSARIGLYKNSLIHDGQSMIVIGNAIDISSRVALEKNLKKAKQLAERNAAAKDQFLANMSHEIRTPMNAILGFTDVLSGTALNSEQAEYVGIIKTAGDNLLGIINDILDFSKIESGTISIETLPFDMADSIKNLYDLLNVKALDKGLRLELQLDERLPKTLLGDRLRLNQVLFNLVGNAIKFTEKGSVSVAAAVIGESKSQCRIRFTVSDTGIGIPKNKLNTIFDRFTQVSSETTRKYGGTGLGLSISKSLVDLLGGDLTVDSQPGSGSAFSFELPFKLSAETGRKAGKPGQVAAQAADANYSILLVEDNELNQKLAVKVIKGFGYAIDVAANGRLGVAQLRKKKYDLVLMDLQMPEMDGYQATDVIRNELKLAVPIIAMTAHSMVGEKSKCLKHGMNDYLAKPFKPEELAYMIRNHIAPTAAVMPEAAGHAVARRVDMAYLKELSGNSADFELEMINLFIDKVPGDVQVLESAIGAGDAGAAKKTLHKLKSSFSMFGLGELLTQQQKLDELLDQPSEAIKIKDIFEDIKSQLGEIYSELEALVRTDYML